MKKNKGIYEITNFNEGIENFDIDKKNKRIKNIIIFCIFIILILLIVLVKIILWNNNESEQVSSMIVQQVEEQKNDQIKLKLEEERKEQERLEQERLKKEEEERLAREAKLPKLTEVGIQNLENIYNSEKKQAFLTFDDGPSNVTHQILDTLKEQNVKATFFVLGSNVVTFPETTKRLYDEGHFIANHGYTHIYSSIYSSKEAVLDEFNRCNDAVKNAIGEPQYNSHLFRFPGGLPGGKYASLKQEAKVLLNENGILNIDWNALTGDAEKQNPEKEELMEKLKQTIEGKNSVVILMHDAQAKKVTADMLPEIITYLREQGYEFKTFYDVIK